MLKDHTHLSMLKNDCYGNLPNIEQDPSEYIHNVTVANVPKHVTSIFDLYIKEQNTVEMSMSDFFVDLPKEMVYKGSDIIKTIQKKNSVFSNDKKGVFIDKATLCDSENMKIYENKQMNSNLKSKIHESESKKAKICDLEINQSDVIGNIDNFFENNKEFITTPVITEVDNPEAKILRKGSTSPINSKKDLEQ